MFRVVLRLRLVGIVLLILGSLEFVLVRIRSRELLGGMMFIVRRIVSVLRGTSVIRLRILALEFVKMMGLGRLVRGGGLMLGIVIRVRFGVGWMARVLRIIWKSMLRLVGLRVLMS